MRGAKELRGLKKVITIVDIVFESMFLGYLV
jgi:hypothetical protein